MKLIQNSVDKEHLLLSESNVELEVEMANFQTVQLNGPKIEERFSQKVPLEEKVQMTNGIHETLEPKSKKISNGYYDGISEEDYQLVLESSSEEGESPLKKIDEDCISAPQLVQEIEDLLGIDSNTVVGMDDELVKESEDSNVTESVGVKEKAREIIVNGEVLTGESLEVEEVSEKTDESGVRSQEEEREEKTEQITSEASKQDSSPNMDLVVDDIEIKCTMDVSSNEELQEEPNISVSLPESEECKLDSAEVKKAKCVEPKVISVNMTESSSIEPDSSGNEIVSSQTSNSEASEEWTVVDSVETDDEDVHKISQPDVPSLSSGPTDQETKESMIVDCESQPEVGPSTIDITTNQEETRKRSASPNDTNSETKKPKLECDAISLVENNLQVLKRPNTDPIDNELKRTKLSDLIPDDEITYVSSQESGNEEYLILDSIDEECPTVDSGECTELEEISEECPISNNINKECENKSLDEDGEIPEEATQEEVEKEKSIVSCKESEEYSILDNINEECENKSVDEDGKIPEEATQEEVEKEKSIVNCEEYSILDNINEECENKSVDEDGKNSEEAKREEFEKEKGIVNCKESEEYPLLDNTNEECENKSVNEGEKISEESRKEEFDKENSIVNCIESEKCPTLDNINEKCENRSVEDGKTSEEAKKEEFAKDQSIVNCKENEESVTSKETVIEQLVEADIENHNEAVNGNSLNVAKESFEKQDSCEEQMEVEEANSTLFQTANELKVCSTECSEKSNIMCETDEIITSAPNTAESIVENHIESSHKEIEEKIEVEETIDSKKKITNVDSVGDENKENVKTKCSIADESCKIALAKTEETADKNIKPVIATNSEKSTTKKTDCEKEQSINSNTNDKISATKPEITNHSQAKMETQKHIAKHIERVLGENHKKTKSPFELLKKNILQTNEDNKKKTNLDLSIDDVVETSRKSTERMLPVLTKFHKDQLKKLTRSDLEEIVVMKICEAITDRSQLGQMRLRCQDLEQNINIWRKKSVQLEKQNRELEMVLKRFLNEKAQSKDQDKVALPIKVTRSVGLQVVLASSMNAPSLMASKAKLNAEIAQNEGYLQRMQQQNQQQQQQLQQHKQQLQQQQQQQQQKQQLARQKQTEIAKEQVRTTAVFTPPVQPGNIQRRGRPLKQSPNTRPAESPSPQPSTSKAPTPGGTLRTLVPIKPATPTKDLEVIDLTEKEEKAKAATPTQNPAAPGIRVTPTSQVCFVQQNATPNQSSPMAYLVQKSNPRQQYLVTTTSASPQKPAVRPLPALATPTFRPAAPTAQPSPKVAARTSSPASASRTSSPASTPMKRPGPRLQNQNPNKHPAPLPAAPQIVPKPGLKNPPAKPQLKIAKTVNGIMLSWSMNIPKEMADMASYQLYAYQESSQPPTTSLWKKVGDVKALPLPMACTLTQFVDGHKYHFAVRAVDVHGRTGPFSYPSSILLTK